MKTKKYANILLVVCFLINLFSMNLSAYAIGNSIDGNVYSAYIPNVGSNSENLKTDVLDNGQNGITVENFKFTKNTDNNFELNGEINEIPFKVLGRPFDSPANENTQVFEANEILGNFDVIYLDVEKEIQDSALYFDSVDLEPYSNVVKLYLRPINSSDFIIIEFFTFADFTGEYLSRPISNEEGVPGKVNQFWYTKIFKPQVSNTQNEVAPRYIDHWAMETEYSHRYNHLGLDLKQVFKIKLYVSYPDSFSNNENFATRFEVTDEQTKCINAPNETSGESNIEARDLRMDIALDTGNVCGGYMITGRTEHEANVSVSLEFNSIPIGDIASISLNYDESFHHNLNDYAETFSTDDGTPREVGAVLDSSESFVEDDDYFNVNWDIQNVGGYGNNKAFKVRFTYRMLNQLNVPDWNWQLFSKDVTVYYDTTA